VENILSASSPSPESARVRAGLSRITVDQTHEALTEMRAFWEEVALSETLDSRILLDERTLGGVRSLWVTHGDADATRTIVYFHGGGYTMGSMHTHRAFAATLSLALGMSVVIPDYRLAPEDPWPAAVEDGHSVWRTLLANGSMPERTIFAGDSAGGGILMSLLLALRDGAEAMPAAALLISPAADLSGTGESLRTKAEVDPVLWAHEIRRVADQYAPGMDAADPRISPVFATLTGLPPLMIQVGTDEVLLSDAQRLAERAREASVEVALHEWAGMWHCFMLMTQLPESRQAIVQVADFVAKHSGKP